MPAVISKVWPDVNYPRIRSRGHWGNYKQPNLRWQSTKEIRNIQVYSLTATSAGGAFIQLLYFSPGFTSLLLYIKNSSRPFESSYMASFITTHTCGINPLCIKNWWHKTQNFCVKITQKRIPVLTNNVHTFHNATVPNNLTVLSSSNTWLN